MRLALIGDVMLGRGVATALESRGPASVWGETLPLLRAAELVVANLECAITTSPTRWTRTPKVYHFRAPPLAVHALDAAGVRLVSLANNHVLDYEVAGLQDTLAQLDAAGIAHAGAGRDLAAAREPAVVEAGGVRVGMLAFTDNEPEWAAGPGRPGVAYLPISTEPEVLGVLEAGVRRARERGAELLILSLHWGPNLVQRPPPRFRDFARAAVALGVDVVYGHSAHLFQGVEVIEGRPVLYDTGDFVDDYAVDPWLRNDLSLLFGVEWSAAGAWRLDLAPVRLRPGRVDPARGADLAEVLARMVGLSAELGTRLVAEGERLHLECPLRGAAP